MKAGFVDWPALPFSGLPNTGAGRYDIIWRPSKLSMVSRRVDRALFGGALSWIGVWNRCLSWPETKAS